MKIESIDCGNYFEVAIIDDDNSIFNCHQFDSKKEKDAFLRGIRCAREIANKLVQSIPCVSIETKMTAIGKF